MTNLTIELLLKSRWEIASPRSYKVSCYHCTTKWNFRFACFYLLCYCCCLSGAVLSVKIVHYASMLWGWDVQSCGIFIREYLRIAFCCWTTISQLPECFFLLFLIFFMVCTFVSTQNFKVGNCSIAGLKKAWNCQYLKSCTGRVYLFCFCLSLHLTELLPCLLLPIGHQCNADAVIFTK